MFIPGRTEALSGGGDYEITTADRASYDVSLDGQRLLIVKRDASRTPSSPIVVVLNWGTS